MDALNLHEDQACYEKEKDVCDTSVNASLSGLKSKLSSSYLSQNCNWIIVRITGRDGRLRIYGDQVTKDAQEREKNMLLPEQTRNGALSSETRESVIRSQSLVYHLRFLI